MKRATIAKAFAITAAVALTLGIGPKALFKANKSSDLESAAALAVRVAPTVQADQRKCSSETLTGPFAFTSTGFITVPQAEAGPFAIVGTQTFDGNGSASVAATVSQNGNIIPVTMAVAYAVNADCTGTFTAQISPVGITTHLFFVIDDNGKELQIIQTDPGVVVTGIARRQ